MVIFLLIIGLCAADASFFSNPFPKNQADNFMTKVENAAADIKNNLEKIDAVEALQSLLFWLHRLIFDLLLLLLGCLDSLGALAYGRPTWVAARDETLLAPPPGALCPALLVLGTVFALLLVIALIFGRDLAEAAKDFGRAGHGSEESSTEESSDSE
jgi:hypothetical protein